MQPPHAFVTGWRANLFSLNLLHNVKTARETLQRLLQVQESSSRSHCENAERLHSFLCSTLEPNTEVFSKVSQSLALVNSVSTLLNKGGIACRRPTFCASAKQTQTLTATLLQPCTSRHERKRGSAVTAAGKASEQHALLHGCSQASSSASKLILCQRKLPKHAKTCHRNVHACQCTKLSRFVKNSVYAKVSSKKYATRLLLERA